MKENTRGQLQANFHCYSLKIFMFLIGSNPKTRSVQNTQVLCLQLWCAFSDVEKSNNNFNTQT